MPEPIKISVTDTLPTSSASRAERTAGSKDTVSTLPPEVSLALVEAERDFLAGKLLDAGKTGGMFLSVSNRLEQTQAFLQKIEGLEKNVEDQVFVLKQRIESLETTSQRMAGRLDARTKEILDTVQQTTKHLDSAERILKEDAVRSLALLKRPVRRLRVRSTLGTLLHLPPRRIWTLLKQFKLLASSPLFDSNYYLARYPDVLAGGMDPILHYLLYGAAENRAPGPNFNGAQYLEANPDVQKFGANPLVHFLQHGLLENRRLCLSPLAVGAIQRQSPELDFGIEGTRAASRPIKSCPQLWHFIGDSVDWLNAHPQLTGVGKVSTELFIASAEAADNLRPSPCVFSHDFSEVVVATILPQYDAFLRKIGFPRKPLKRSLSSLAYESPEPGDHVFFTGLVWTPSFTALFKRLSQRGIEFSVLVFDIIPIERPDLVGKAAHESFSEWLGTTLNTASIVFVSSQIVKDQILRWALLCGREVKAELITIPFGLREIADPASPENLGSDPVTSKIDLDKFVLCVGTIDQRKNQLFLCQVWKRLAQEIGINNLPQLVLAGRDDLKLEQTAPDISDLIAGGKIVVAEGLSDQQIAGLYQACLFTAFPSTSEGYGLPVAESLQHGKLCLTSNLPVIREHAGDLAWYFNNKDVADALSLFMRAIQEPEIRKAAETRITKNFRPPTWKDTYETMARSAQRALRSAAVEVQPGPQLPPFPGTRAVDPLATLAKAAQWCRGHEPDVSIIVLNWNAASLTRECIRQILSQTDGYFYEIIVADNGSAPSDVRKLRHLGSGVRLLELGCNRFFGEANNIAAEAARGRYLCLLNNDAFVQPGWLTSLVNALEEQPEVGAAGPMFLFPDGMVQEAGASIDPQGFPVRFGRGEQPSFSELLTARYVDYISAAALVLRRDLFIECGGFDLAYEPAYYEDPDLCFKLQALGRKILYCPEAKVTHIEGHAANDNAEATSRRNALGDINRGKFVSRWGEYLRTRDRNVLAKLRSQVLPPRARAEVTHPLPNLSGTAAVYTPFLLTAGGGEAYLLTLATVLAQRYKVSLVTPHLVSNIRLQNLGRELGLDLSGLSLVTEDAFLRAQRPDLMVTMGNHILPSIPGLGKDNIYVCQFPFPMEAANIQARRSFLESYRTVIVYSDYASAHVYTALSAYRLASKTITVVHPPVQLIQGDASKKKNMILSVGRFYVGGHNKRHDALIEAFKCVAGRSDQALELHLAGSSIPEPRHMDYLAQLMAAAQGFRVHFHVNVSSKELSQLYEDAAVYWHGTGIGADLVSAPEKAEHFGISLVEAMSAQAVPLALAAGGPREIISHGENGFLYDAPDELTDLTLKLFTASTPERRIHMGQAAARRAGEFSREAFQQRLNALVDELTRQSI